MSKSIPVRVVATHDFCCSYLSSPTSYGKLPIILDAPSAGNGYRLRTVGAGT